MKEKYIQNAMTQFLRDTVTHFTSSNRATNVLGCCVYSPTPKSCGCAIGRHIPNKAICRQLDEFHPGEATVNYRGVREALPSSLLMLDSVFLSRVQVLHDSLGCWTELGLSEEGVAMTLGICEGFELDSVEILASHRASERLRKIKFELFQVCANAARLRR